MNRNDETHLAEALFHYNIAHLPYGPLAGGTLSGKYAEGDAKVIRGQRCGQMRRQCESKAALRTDEASRGEEIP